MGHWDAQSWVIFLGAIGALVGCIATATGKVLTQLKELTLRVDGRLTQLLATTQEAWHQIGLKEGKEEATASGELKAAILRADSVVTDGPVTVVGSPVTVNSEPKPGSPGGGP